MQSLDFSKCTVALQADECHSLTIYFYDLLGPNLHIFLKTHLVQEWSVVGGTHVVDYLGGRTSTSFSFFCDGHKNDTRILS